MEKFFTNKNIWKKIVVAVLVVMAFQFIVNMPVVHAKDEAYGEEEGDALGFGGVLLKPLMSLLVTLGDGIMQMLHSAIMGVESSLLHIDLDNDWIETLIKIILVAVTAVALIVTVGLTNIATAVVIAVAASMFGVNVIPLAEEGLNNAASAVCSTIYGDNTPGDLYLPTYSYTPEEIFKGRILLFNVNFFDSANDELQVCYDIDPTTSVGQSNTTNNYQGGVGKANSNNDGATDQRISLQGYKDLIKQVEKDKKDDVSRYHIKYYFYEDSNGKEIKTSAQDSATLLTGTISKWYVTIRNICIVAMLSVLIYIGIRMLLSTVSSDKAKYKEMIKDWLVGLCLLFVMHYIMAFSVMVVQKFTDMVAVSVDEDIYAKVLISNDKNDENDLGKGTDSDKAKKFKEAIEKEGMEEYIHDGNGNWIWWTNLMGHLRLSMQFDKISGKYIGEAICFLALVIYTVIFTFTYLKRLLYMAFLTVISPFVALTYCIDKVNDGQAQGFNTWLKEYIFNLLIQPLHLMLYYILVTSAMDLAGSNVIYSLVAIGFMIPAEKMLRSIFGFQKAHTPPLLGGPLGTTLMMQGFNKLTGNVANGKLGNNIPSSSSSASNSTDDSSTRFAGDVPELGTILAGDDGEQTTEQTVTPNNNQPDTGGINENIQDDQEQPAPRNALEDLDQEQQELENQRMEEFGFGFGRGSEADKVTFWNKQLDLNRRRSELLNQQNNDSNSTPRTVDTPEVDNNDYSISPWATNTRDWYNGVIGNGNRSFNTRLGFGAHSLLQRGKDGASGAKAKIKGFKQNAHNAYSQFDRNMNHLAPKHWRRAKIAGNTIKNVAKNSARTMGGMAVGAMAAAPLAGLALAGGIASGDPSKTATAVGAALATGGAVSKRAASAKASNFISPEVQEAIDSVDNGSMYKEQRQERRIKELRKDEKIKRTLESLDKETGRKIMDNNHFDEYVKNGYTTDRKGLQQMIASEKLIEDTSRETRNIDSVAKAAAVKKTVDRMGKAPKDMKEKDRREWHQTHVKDYSAYGDRAESMADQTMLLAQKFDDNMPL